MQRCWTRSRGTFGFVRDLMYSGEPQSQEHGPREITDGDHVFLNVLAEVDASIEALRDNVSAAVICRNVEHDVRISAYQFAYFRCHHARRQPRYKQTDAAGGFA